MKIFHVIIYNVTCVSLQHICRGATISGGAEIYGRSSLDFFFSGGENIPDPDAEGNASEAAG